MSNIKVSGAWKGLASGTGVKISGAWKNVAQVYQKIGGVWKSGWAAVVVALTGSGTVSSGPSATYVSLVVKADGTITKETNGGLGNSTLGAWIDPTSAASGAYQVQFVSSTGDAPNDGVALNTWFDTSVDRFVGYTSGSDKTGTVTLAIREGTGATIDSKIYTITLRV